ncbi:cytochrome c oxidase, subunit VIIa [Cynara cardunculus var. scolymus]|uniref:Cytochrome c oxidase, subunit VIIa n=1 Tax=Cynara cardunculus var. scolymus TaxID=59895 RepID=A0A103XH45_CYNCS|nr:cytochrome c oxidase, subunit VIIa [Cynara cardunculus var. scolymus]
MTKANPVNPSLSIGHVMSKNGNLELVDISCRMVDEAPFRPRVKLIEKQRLYQSIHRHTHLKGPMDKITSVAIPLALAGSSLFLIVSLPSYSLPYKAMFGKV